jgi:undecaprenyl-diphosphatase
MDNILTAVVLGIVEGLTEFLPVSSTGHLILTGHLMGFTGEKADSFEVIIQLGAILAVVVMYRDRFLGLLRANPYRRFSGMRGLVLLGLTCVPAALVGFFTHKAIKTHLFGPTTVALALAVGAVAIFVVEGTRRRVRYETLDDISPALALGVGLFQCLSLWPGFSRSAATIMGGMVLGAKRSLAAEYSFIAAVPIMCVATAYDFYKTWGLYESGDLLVLGVGFVVSFFAAWAAVRAFILVVGRNTLRPFAWYRLALAAAVFFFWPK